MFYMCIYIYNSYIKLKPDVHMYTHTCVCIDFHIMYMSQAYVQII